MFWTLPSSWRRAGRDGVAEGGPAASKPHHLGASSPHHPVATRHPSSTRRGMFWTLPSCEGGQDATVSRRVVLRQTQNPHHPVASRHPSSTRRGMFCTLPSSWRRAGRDSVAEGGPTANPKPTPPRRFAPPLLDEEGSVLDATVSRTDGLPAACCGYFAALASRRTTFMRCTVSPARCVQMMPSRTSLAAWASIVKPVAPCRSMLICVTS